MNARVARLHHPQTSMCILTAIRRISQTFPILTEWLKDHFIPYILLWLSFHNVHHVLSLHNGNFLHVQYINLILVNVRRSMYSEWTVKVQLEGSLSLKRSPCPLHPLNFITCFSSPSHSPPLLMKVIQNNLAASSLNPIVPSTTVWIHCHPR